MEILGERIYNIQSKIPETYCISMETVDMSTDVFVMRRSKRGKL